MASGHDLVFELKGKLPKQVALSRMASYMAEFATLIGGKGEILFSDVREGSTCIAAKVGKGGSVNQSRERAVLASRGSGPRDAQKAFEKICQMSQEDNLPAKIRANSAIILHFPTPKLVRSALKIQDYGSLTGELSGIVRDGKAGVKARIRPLDGGPLIYCTADEKTGRELGNYFLGFVRVFGNGWWSRSADGEWFCDSLHVESAYKVNNVSVSEAFKTMRELDVEWSEDPFGFDEDVRTA